MVKHVRIPELANGQPGDGVLFAIKMGLVAGIFGWFIYTTPKMLSNLELFSQQNTLYNRKEGIINQINYYNQILPQLNQNAVQTYQDSIALKQNELVKIDSTINTIENKLKEDWLTRN